MPKRHDLFSWHMFYYLSNDKADHSGKTMSSGVRKRKWHKSCKRLFTIFFFQVKYRHCSCIPSIKRNASQFLEKSVKVKNSVKFSFLRISFH